MRFKRVEPPKGGRAGYRWRRQRPLAPPSNRRPSMERKRRQRPCLRYPERIPVRATGEEKRRIARRAKAARLSASRYLVRAATAERLPPTAEERQFLERLLYLVLKCGTNLNQLAHHKNRARYTGEPPPAEAAVAAAAREVGLLAAEIRRRL